MIANKVLDYNTGKRITCVLLGKQTGYTDDRIGRWLKQQQNMNITSQRDGVDAAVQLWLNNQKNRIKLTKNPALVDLGSPGERMSAGKTHSCSFTVVLLGQGCNTTGASARHPFTPGVMTREFISVAAGRHKSTNYYESAEARNMARAIFDCVTITSRGQLAACAHAIDWDIWDEQHREWVGSVKIL